MSLEFCEKLAAHIMADIMKIFKELIAIIDGWIDFDQTWY